MDPVVEFVRSIAKHASFFGLLLDSVSALLESGVADLHFAAQCITKCDFVMDQMVAFGNETSSMPFYQLDALQASIFSCCLGKT